MKNKKKYIILVIILFLVASGFYFYRLNFDSTNCDKKLSDMENSFDVSVGVDDYIERVSSFFYDLNIIQKIKYLGCSKGQLILFYFNKHPLINAELTESESGIRFYREDEKVWSNIFLIVE